MTKESTLLLPAAARLVPIAQPCGRRVFKQADIGWWEFAARNKGACI